ncbi:26S proteasome non-ATPase regulatory subunit 4-like protein, partial [Trifolium pratense]
DDENALLQQALAMSMDDAVVNHDVRDADMSEAATDDVDLARALQLSQTPASLAADPVGRLLADQSFVSSVLASAIIERMPTMPAPRDGTREG